MDQAKILISVGTAALSLVFSSQPHPLPFWETNIVIAADDTSSKRNVHTDEDSSSKMDKGQGTQTDAAKQETVLARDK